MASVLIRLLSFALVGAVIGSGVAVAQLRPGVVRLAAVNTPEYSGLLDDLIAVFKQESGTSVEVYSGEDVYEQAREGRADLIISHYGKPELQPFMEDGLGQWPLMVFANQQLLVGPTHDPAHVRGLADLGEAFRRIAESESPYLVNGQDGLQYLEAIAWEAAGGPEKGAWYQDAGLRGPQAVTAAGQQGAYILWGAFPFLRFQQERPELGLEAMVLADPLLQRVMVSVVVRPDRFPGANVEGALAFQRFLLTPATQARILTYRAPGFDQQLWWPAARNNNPALLPR